tara:strand:+ start:1955 stop:2455 length:501 start_codon:yes stop_codon:yes gene_type:complete
MDYSERYRQESGRLEAEGQQDRIDSINKQRISQNEARENKLIRREERKALSQATTTQRRREVKEEADELREGSKQRAANERGKVENGAIYDLKVYEPFTDNKTGTDNQILSDGIDTISGEAPPGDSSGTLPGGGGSGDLDGGSFTLNVVKNDNSAGTATFIGSGVN